ncbi:RICIN domain-containing protein [Nostoc sp. FACHB-888]|nr:RICIN domain-containing protein [Nostoc sp. FACHB-888]
MPFALEAKGAGTTDGTLVQQNSWNGGCGQLWKIELLDDGSYKVRSACSDKVLDVTDASQDDGALIHLWSSWNGTNQQWTFEPMP